MRTSREVQVDIDYWNDKQREAGVKLRERTEEFNQAIRHEQEEQQKKMKRPA